MEFENVNMDNDTEIVQKEKKQKKGGFAKGVLTGTLGTLAVIVLVLTVFINVLGNSLVIGPKVSGKEKNASVLNSEVMGKINELMGYIHLYFYDETESEKLANGLYAGLLEGLDDVYSQYYTAQEYADMQISATQNYCGIGAAMTQDRDTMQVTVSHVYEGSPAEAAGIRDGDMLVMVEDIEATSMELDELVTHIRGDEGTVVHLQIYREGETDFLDFAVTRAHIDLPTIEHKLLNGNIGYIQILDFGAPTSAQFASAVEELKQQGMEAMIIDVRDNPGGMVTAVTEILDSILPEGLTVYIQDKYGNKDEYTSDAENFMDMPMAVLINGNSASASEILAGAIRDYEYGTLIGTKTYGKGIVQTIYPLGEGDAVKLTTAKYFTPNGENIHGTGIEPDIKLEFEYQGEITDTYDEMQDNQILKALEVLESELAK
ncbi:MAG: S41 family peptidase [Lachnospiraceae bacterium]|nr:S41 family peptidase [Lachnospiraceae bacterium]